MKDAPICVELVTKQQHESLTELLCEVHAYYNPGASVPRELVREHLTANLLAPQSPHRLFAARRRGSDVVGFAAVTLVYSLVNFEADRRRQCQLKELFVTANERGTGVGSALMAGVAKYACLNGCQRIDWPVKSTNERGIAFYEMLGARLVSERLSFRLVEPALGVLAGRAM